MTRDDQLATDLKVPLPPAIMRPNGIDTRSPALASAARQKAPIFGGRPFESTLLQLRSDPAPRKPLPRALQEARSSPQ
jgi:hypothetical protein